MKSIPSLLMILALAACASTHTLKESDRSAISTVAINPDIHVSPDLYYFGPGSTIGLLFGAVGGAATAAANRAPADELKEFAKDNGISIAEIVRKQFVAQLLTTGKFRVSEDHPNAVFRLDISQYGLSIPNGFSGSLVPILSVHAELLNDKGEVVWATTGRVHPLSGVVDSVSPETLRANPQILRNMWTQAAQQAVLDMMQTL
jgi:hypothetical protein